MYPRRNKYSNSSLSGFNLVEAAIVLGVVGLVIGGIWTAASAVSEQNQINRINNVFGVAISNIDQLTASRQDLTGATTQTLMVMGVLPAGANYESVSGYDLAAYSDIKGYFYYVPPAPTNHILLYAYGPPPWNTAGLKIATSVCIKAANALFNIVKARTAPWVITIYTSLPFPVARYTAAGVLTMPDQNALSTRCSTGIAWLRLDFQ